MAIDPVTGKVTEKLFDRIWNEIKYLFIYEENKENLGNDLNVLDGKTARVKELVEEAEGNVKSIHTDVEKWVERVEVIKKEANEVVQGKVQMSFFCIRFPNIKSRYSLSRKATRLSGKIKDLIQEARDFGTDVGYRTSKRQNKYHLPHDFEKFESRSLTMKKVLEKLEDPETRIIGICGMPGVGKTKLAMEIADRVKVEKLFDDVTFATVSRTEDFNTTNVKRIQAELAAGLRLDISDVKDSPLEIAKRLSERLSLGGGDGSSKDEKKKRNILVILDDVWDSQNLDLPSLGIPIKNGHEEGLKVMITSRFKQVCQSLGATNEGTIEVEVMQEKEACLLFKEIAGISDDDDNNDLKKIAEEVAKECGGLPLSIVCIGGLLKNKKDLSVWRDVLTQLRNSEVETINGQKNLVFSRIKLSYKNLEDEKYKSLLLLCSLFPEDYEIHIETLVRYVKGLEVFDDDASKILTMVETRNKVDTIVDHLKDCNLLLTGIKSGRRVKLHDAVRDVCLSILATEEKEREVGQGGSNNIRFMSRQVFRYKKEREIQISTEDIKKDVVKVLELKSQKGLSQLPSLLQCNFKSLRQLSLEHIFFLRNEVLSCIRLLETLEILSFYNSRLACFPKEVAELKNLKLLDLRYRSVYTFPIGVFSGLKKLEELYMRWYDIQGGESTEMAETTRITEARSLSNLTTFQIKGVLEKILQILRHMDTKKMERFDIGNGFIPRLQDYEVQRCIELHGTALKAISLDSGENRNFGILVKKSNTLRLTEIAGLRNVVPEFDGDGLTNLKSLELKDCADLEYIADASDVVDMMSTRNRLLLNQRDPLRSLEALLVDGCANLKSLYCCGRIQSTWWLCNIKYIKIFETKAMTSLFSHLNLKLFVHLEELEIVDCPALENIIDMEIEDIEEQQEIVKLPHLKKQFEFSKLRKIVFEDLEKLRSFSPAQDFTLTFPSLTLLKLHRCPQLKRFSYGKLSAPNLKSLEGDVVPSDLEEFVARTKGDTTIQ